MLAKFRQFIESRSELALFIWAAAIITGVRIAVLMVSGAELGPDESQYWFWSQTPDFGYFSKPPMIAWAIATTTALFGNGEWAVRLSAPIFHLGTASFLFFTTRIIADDTENTSAPLWAGLIWLTLPGVALSSFVMATDAPLLFFWSGALYFFAKIATENNPRLSDFCALGACLGAGLLSKYAMIYFPIAIIVALITNQEIRARALNIKLTASALIAALLIAPNIAWNAAHDFQTVSHTAANANWGAGLFNFGALFTFLTGQFAVAGLIPIGFLMAALANTRTRNHIHQKPILKTLALFVLIPLIVVSIQAFISRAHANWAAAAYPALVILMSITLTSLSASLNANRWLKINLAFNGLIAAAFAFLIANIGLIDAIGASAATREIRGWRAQTDIIAAQSEKFETIAIDDRALMGAMLYYQREKNLNLVAMDPNNGVDHHYEAFMAFDPNIHNDLLFVTTRGDSAHVDYRFNDIVLLARVDGVPSAPERSYHLYRISDYFGPR